jgi:hypothetical protein
MVKSEMDIRTKGSTDMKGNISVLAMIFIVAAGVTSGQRWEYAGDFETSRFLPRFFSGAISGDLLVLGTEIFHWDGTSWTFVQQLECEGLQPHDRVQGICLQDDRCLLGVPTRSWDDEYPSQGCVYAYRRVGNQWQLEQKIAVDGTDSFGSSIALDGDTAAIVASSGLYLYEYRGVRWEPAAIGAPCPENQWIWKVVKSGSYWLVVGTERTNSQFEQYTDIVNLYRLDGNQWILLGDIRFDQRIQDVVFKEDHLAVISGADPQHADLKMYHFDGQVWKPIVTFPCPNGQWRYGGRIGFSSTPGELLLAEIMDEISEAPCTVNLYTFQEGRWDLIERIDSTPFDPDYGVYFAFPVFDHEKMIISNGTLGVFSYRRCPAADLTNDCRVDLADFAALAGEWMTGPGNIR